MTELTGTLGHHRYRQIWDTVQTLRVADFHLTEIITPRILEEKILLARQYAEMTLTFLSEVRASNQVLTQALNNRKLALQRRRDDLLVNDESVYKLKPVARVEAALNVRLQEILDEITNLENTLSDHKVLMTELDNRKSELATTGTNFRVAKESMQYRMALEYTSKTGMPAPVLPSSSHRTSRLGRAPDDSPSIDLARLRDVDDDDEEDVLPLNLKLSPAKFGHLDRGVNGVSRMETAG